jgi:hypothetical protein
MVSNVFPNFLVNERLQISMSEVDAVFLWLSVMLTQD